MLKAGFSRWRRPALKPLFAGRPHRGMECRQPRTPNKATPRATPVSEPLYARTAGDVDAFEDSSNRYLFRLLGGEAGGAGSTRGRLRQSLLGL